MFDTRNPRTSGLAVTEGGRPSLGARLRHHLKRMARTPLKDWAPYLAERWITLRSMAVRKAWRLAYRLKFLNDRRGDSRGRDIEQITVLAVSKHEPAPYDGRVILVRPEDRVRIAQEDPTCGWGSLVADLQIHEVPGNHRTMFERPHVAILGSILCEMMDGEVYSAFSAQPVEAAHAGPHVGQ